MATASTMPATARIARRHLRHAVTAFVVTSLLIGLSVLASGPAAASPSSRLGIGGVLHIGRALVSHNGEYRFVMQRDDNAVEYLASRSSAFPAGALWSTATVRPLGHRVDAAFSLDTRCRPYLFDVTTSRVIWRAVKVPLASHCFILLQDDGNFADYGYTASSPETAVLLWQTRTRTRGAAIATLASDQLGDHNCSVNSLGTVGFGSTYTNYESCKGAADPTGEYWCSDFASWVWEHAVTDGFDVVPTYTDPNQDGGAQQAISPWAPNFARYGWSHGTFHDSGTPIVGNVVLLSNTPSIRGGKLTESNVDRVIEHVAIVSKVSGTHLWTISGDWGGTGTGRTFWSSSTVTLIESGFTLGASFGGSGLVVAGWVSPVIS
jgi:hypothetical protein